MSFLAPLYLLASLAVAAPILLHLIRRQPKGEIEFSSLMFLDPTPPRLTKRSRLENLLLLLFRCLVIGCLALAFARPFLPSTQTTVVDDTQDATIVLIDRSASMRRDTLWQQANDRAKSVIRQQTGGLVSVIAFDETQSVVLSLRNASELSSDALSAAAEQAIEDLNPTWQATDLGGAIRFAADLGSRFALEQADSDGVVSNTRIVLISDLQAGAATESLQGYEWPENVWLDLQTVRANTRGNLTARILNVSDSQAGRDEEAKQPDLRVKVSQAADGNDSMASLSFDGETKPATTVRLSAGISQVAPLELPSDAGTTSRARLSLSGDQDEFDNTFYFVRPKRAQQQLMFVGSEGPFKDARDSLTLFVSQVPWSDASRAVEFVAAKELPAVLPDSASTPLLLLTPSLLRSESGDSNDPLEHTNEQTLARVTEFLSQGGRVLVVLDRELETIEAKTLGSLLRSPELVSEPSQGDDFRLISAVDFDDPIIAPLSQPSTGDFSNIRIWKHQRLRDWSAAVNVTLGLDDGSPLLLRRTVPSNEPQTPDGVLWVLTAGWQPSNSQLALSTKFVPLLLGMLGPNRQLPPQSLTIGDLISQPSSETDAPQRATEPGFVTREDGSIVAVNLAATESETHPLDPDRLSQFGVILTSQEQKERDKDVERSMKDIELESRQSWWQWLILATLGLIGVETVLAARQSSSAVKTSAGESDG